MSALPRPTAYRRIRRAVQIDLDTILSASEETFDSADRVSEPSFSSYNQEHAFELPSVCSDQQAMSDDPFHENVTSPVTAEFHASSYPANQYFCE